MGLTGLLRRRQSWLDGTDLEAYRKTCAPLQIRLPKAETFQLEMDIP